MNYISERSKNSLLQPWAILLTAVSALTNIVLSMIFRATDLPFCFDTVGTIAASALGGIIPGIVTAFLTGVVYASLNLLTAVISSLFFGEFAAYRRKLRIIKHDKTRDYGQWRLFDISLFVLVLAVFVG